MQIRVGTIMFVRSGIHSIIDMKYLLFANGIFTINY